MSEVDAQLDKLFVRLKRASGIGAGLIESEISQLLQQKLVNGESLNEQQQSFFDQNEKSKAEAAVEMEVLVPRYISVVVFVYALIGAIKPDLFAWMFDEHGNGPMIVYRLTMVWRDYNCWVIAAIALAVFVGSYFAPKVMVKLKNK